MPGKFKILGHPVHPIATDFPIVLWLTSLLGDFIYVIMADPMWYKFSFWLLALGCISALPAAVTGLLEYILIPNDNPAASKATWHMYLVIIAAVLFFLSLMLKISAGNSTPIQEYTAIALSVFGALFVTAGGFLGGELVFRFGVGCENVTNRV